MQFIDHAHSLLQEFIKPRGIKILSLVGLMFLATKTLSTLNSIRRTLLPFAYTLPSRYGHGSWALVTGGAQGIGAAFATELAGKGFNLIIIDLNTEKLNEVKTAINMKFPLVEIKTITCNFNESWKEGFFDSLIEQLDGCDISILVNNVGIGTPPGPIYEVPEEAIRDAITVNILPMTMLSRRLIPQMMKRSPRSAIINISSITGVFPAVWLAVYSSTKAYVDFFTRAIEKDVQDKIDVLSVRPGAVSTALIGKPKIGSGVVSPSAVAISSLRKLGKVTFTFGHWSHEFTGWFNTIPGMKKYTGRVFFKKILGLSNFKH